MKHGHFLLKYKGEFPVKRIRFNAVYLGERKIPLDRFNSKRKYTNGLYTVEQISRQTRGRK
jgi:hypothetical protein